VKNRRLINIKAIVVGFLSDFVASHVFRILLLILATIIIAGKGYEGDDLEKMLLSVIKETPFRIFSFAAALGFTMLGGYIAGRLAGGGELFHAGAVGIIRIVLSLFFSPLHFTWHNLLAFILILPAAIIGGNIAKERRLKGQGDGPALPGE